VELGENKQSVKWQKTDDKFPTLWGGKKQGTGGKKVKFQEGKRALKWKENNLGTAKSYMLAIPLTGEKK